MDKHDAQVIADLAMGSVQASVDVAAPGNTGEVEELTFVHKDMKEIDVERFRDHPKRIKAKIELTNITSFINYLVHYGQFAMVTGYNIEEGTLFSAILDYHIIDGDPQWCDHRVSMNVTHSPQWVKWVNGEKTRMSQRKFSEFIEDNIEDVVEPDTGKLLQMIKDVSVSANRDSKRKVTNAGDSGSDHGGVMITSGVPEPLTLALKPWKGMDTHMAIKARVYTHIEEDHAVRFSYQLINTEQAIEAKFKEYCELIEADAEVEVYI